MELERNGIYIRVPFIPVRIIFVSRRGVAECNERQAKMKLSTSPLGAVKKRERKVGKGKGKETSPGSSKNPLSPRGRAQARGVEREVEKVGGGGQRKISRYRLAGAAAEELIKILGAKPTEDNRRLWAYYCYHHDIEIIFEKAYQYASEHRQGEIRNPVTAFQRWLKVSFADR